VNDGGIAPGVFRRADHLIEIAPPASADESHA